MKSVRCSACNSIISKEEGDKIILRTGYGKSQVFHLFNKDGASITCWHCKEINNLGGKNVVGRKS